MVALALLTALTMVLTMVAPTAADVHCGVTVTSDGSIQDAIDAAEEGDVICLGAGPHTLAGTLDIDVNRVVIEGSAEGTTLDASGSGYAVLWTADGATLKDVTLDGGGNYGIKMQAPIGSATPLSGATLENVVVENSTRTAIDLNFVEDVTLDTVTARDTTGGAGIAMISADNVTLNNVTTDSNAWGGVAVYTDASGHFGGPPEPGSGLTITGLTSVDNVPLYGEGANGGEISGLDAPQFTHIVHSPDHRSNGGDFTFYVKSEARGVALANALPGTGSATLQSRDGDDFFVGDGMSIQAAVDAAEGGEIISVGTGTYSGFGVEEAGPTGLTIQAADGATPVIDAPSGRPARMVDLWASGTAFRGFTIVNSTTLGIKVTGTGWAIEDNTVSGGTTAIQTSNESADGSLTLTGNTIEDSTVGISLMNGGNTVSGNIVRGVTSEGIATSASGNTITDNQFGVSGPEAKLALAYGTATLDVRGNWWGSTPPDTERFEDFTTGTIEFGPWCTNADCTEFSPGSTATVCPGVACDFTSIQAAVDAASPGDTVDIGAGDYAERVHVRTSGLTLQGVRDETVVLNPAHSAGLTVDGDGVTIRNLTIDEHNGTVRNGYAVRLGSVTNTALDGVTLTGGNTGLHVPLGVSVVDLTVTDSHFDGNTFGWYFEALKDAGDPSSTVDGVVVTDSTFNDNAQKGLYVEKLENAVFDRIVVDGSGDDPNWRFNNGIDINLKHGTYEDITIRNSQVTDSGLDGAGQFFAPAGIAVKARDDGSLYSTHPATLTGVTIRNVEVKGGVVGVRIGEEGKDNAGPTGVAISRSTLRGTGGLGLVNVTQSRVTATHNWWAGTGNPSDQVEGDVRLAPWCRNASCSTPPADPPVTPDAPPAPPVIVPPKPSTPPRPITTPPGQSVNQQPGQGGAFVGGQPAQTDKQQVPPPPPPSQRSEQDKQQIRQSAQQVVGNVTSMLPSNTPPPVTVEDSDDGAVVNGLLSKDGEPTKVPAENVVSVSAGNTGLIVAGADGNGDPTNLGDNGSPTTTPGGSVGTVAVGFTPSSQGQVQLFSDPIVLGEFTTDEDGSFKGQVTVPDWVPAGDHTLVVAGDGPDGEVALMLGITVEGDAPFTDVGSEATHAVAIARLKSLGITHGYADGTFDPSGDIIRGQMAAFLARALDLDTEVETDLSDAVGTHGDAIAAVVAAGVAGGYEDGTFRPNETVTRGQMATFLANAAGLEPIGTSSVSDAVGAHADPIDAVVEAGLASGYPDGTFRPAEPVTRAQMATFVVNLVDYLDS